MSVLKSEAGGLTSRLPLKAIYSKLGALTGLQAPERSNLIANSHYTKDKVFGPLI